MHARRSRRIWGSNAIRRPAAAADSSRYRRVFAPRPLSFAARLSSVRRSRSRWLASHKDDEFFAARSGILMDIHEYQAKAVLRDFGVPVPRGIAVFSVAEAEAAANTLGGPVWVVKAQIHAGGRGKAGGVKVVKEVAEVKREATRLLGSTLVTHQTGPQGKEGRRLS